MTTFNLKVKRKKNRKSHNRSFLNKHSLHKEMQYLGSLLKKLTMINMMKSILLKAQSNQVFIAIAIICSRYPIK